MKENVPKSYFDRMYAAANDPWQLATRWYERRKYDCSLAALPRRRYRSAYEPGCSVGVLSARLASRCDRLLCTDLLAAPVRVATARLADEPQVRVERQVVPEQWPQETFDLVVISELAYYFGAADRARLWDRVAASLEPEGTLLAAHWRPPVAEHATDGDTVHAELADRPEFTSVSRQVDPDFRIDVYQAGATPIRSVAQLEGLR